jgi:hypothetical protein
LIERLIAKLRPSCDELCGLDWGIEEAAAEVICEMKIVDALQGRWKEPVSAVVTVPISGVQVAKAIAVRLVEAADAEFNGTLVSLLAGECWRLCASRLEDGTLLPLDGTRRSALAAM